MEWSLIDRSLNYGRHHIKNFLLDAVPYISVLDLGAGKGDDLMIARSITPEAKLYALEFYAPNVEKLTNMGVEVFSFDIERNVFPFADGSLDIVILNNVFEHVKEVFWILHEITRVLKVGGHLIIGVPNLAALHNRILLLFGKQPSSLKNSSAHVRGYTKKDMISMLDTGFENGGKGYKLRNFKGSNFYPFPPSFAKPLANLMPALSTCIFFNFEKIKPYGRGYLDYPVQQSLETNFFLGNANTN